MPIVRLFTNQSRITFQSNLSKELVKIIATSLDRPVDHISLCIIPDCIMMFGGSEAPHAQIVITAIGTFDEKVNPKHCAAINTFVAEKLMIPLDRVLIEFCDVKPFEVGLGTKTSAEIFAEAKK